MFYSNRFCRFHNRSLYLWPVLLLLIINMTMIIFKWLSYFHSILVHDGYFWTTYGVCMLLLCNRSLCWVLIPKCLQSALIEVIIIIDYPWWWSVISIIISWVMTITWSWECVQISSEQRRVADYKRSCRIEETLLIFYKSKPKCRKYDFSS